MYERVVIATPPPRDRCPWFHDLSSPQNTLALLCNKGKFSRVHYFPVLFIIFLGESSRYLDFDDWSSWKIWFWCPAILRGPRPPPWRPLIDSSGATIFRFYIGEAIWSLNSIWNVRHVYCVRTLTHLLTKNRGYMDDILSTHRDYVLHSMQSKSRD